MARTRSEKLAIMHRRYGRECHHRCSKCIHHITKYNDKPYHKCKVYGVSMSEATDFAADGIACGLYDKETMEKDVYLTLNRRKEKEELQKEVLF